VSSGGSSLCFIGFAGLNFGVDLLDGGGDLVVDDTAGEGEPVLGLHGTGDGGEGDTQDAQSSGDRIGIGLGIEGFDERRVKTRTIAISSTRFLKSVDSKPERLCFLRRRV
jgi:hypothetical protein